jgi:hypothetical protein
MGLRAPMEAPKAKGLHNGNRAQRRCAGLELEFIRTLLCKARLIASIGAMDRHRRPLGNWDGMTTNGSRLRPYVGSRTGVSCELHPASVGSKCIALT